MERKLIEEDNKRNHELTGTKKIIAILWLSFIMAGIATGAFFSAIDPDILGACVSFPEISRMGAYSVGFLLFWLLTASTCVLANMVLGTKNG